MESKEARRKAATNRATRRKAGGIRPPAAKPERWQCSNGAIYSDRQAAEEYQQSIDRHKEIKSI